MENKYTTAKDIINKIINPKATEEPEELTITCLCRMWHTSIDLKRRKAARELKNLFNLDPGYNFYKILI